MTLMQRRRTLMAGLKELDDGNLVSNFTPGTYSFGWWTNLSLTSKNLLVPGHVYRIEIDATVSSDARIIVMLVSGVSLGYSFPTGQDGPHTVRQELLRTSDSNTDITVYCRPGSNDGVQRTATIRSFKIYDESA